MRQYIIFLITAGVVLMAGCRERTVYYPIPLSSKVIIIIQAENGGYDYKGSINTDSIFADLQEELSANGLSLQDLDRIKLEGVAYTILATTDSGAVINGLVDVNYNDTTSASFKNVMTLTQVNLGQILKIPQVEALTADGVTLLNQALQDIIYSPGIPNIIVVKSRGSLVTGNPSVRFTMQVDFTITALVRSKVTIFDPLG